MVLINVCPGLWTYLKLSGMCSQYQGIVQVIIVQICGVLGGPVLCSSSVTVSPGEDNHGGGMWERGQIIPAFPWGSLDKIGGTYSFPWS